MMTLSPQRLEKAAEAMQTRHWVSREMLRNERNVLFVFGDNMERWGLGGQAREMRGEPNAVGIPTKWRPSYDIASFFIDADMPAVQGVIDEAFNRLETHIKSGGTIVWPEAGIGTGLADLKSKAPRIFSYIENRRSLLSAELTERDAG